MEQTVASADEEAGQPQSPHPAGETALPWQLHTYHAPSIPLLEVCPGETEPRS